MFMYIINMKYKLINLANFDDNLTWILVFTGIGEK